MLLGTYLWRFWQMRGHLHEARTRLEAILAMPGSRDHPTARRHALEAAGGVAYWQADMPAAQRFYDECLELTRDTGDMRAIANAIYNSAFPKVIDRSDVPEAFALLQEALPMFREVGDDLGVGRCLWAIGNCWYFQDRPDPAVEPLDEAINIFRRLGAGFDLGWALHMRALVAIKQMDPVTATVLAQEALRMFSAVRDVSGLVLLVGNFAEIARLEGDLTRAIRLAGASAAHEASTGAGIAGLAIAIDQRLRDRISGEEEERAWAEGQAMSIEDAVAYALERAPAPSPSAGGSSVRS
jgi:tetratricopeptide (TPR) repeat protein